ncbi:MAG: hypothetical protein N2512_11190 [Armatimonadetes bacterium]|nr:hypothetical protein [Armatimonadota bacterium]
MKHARNKGQLEVSTAIAALTVFVLIVCVSGTADICKLANARAVLANAAEMAALAGASVSRNSSEAQTWHLAASHFRDNLTGGVDSAPIKCIGHLAKTSPMQLRGAIYSCGPFRVIVWYPYADERTDALGLDPRNLICVEAELWSVSSPLKVTRLPIRIAHTRAVAAVGTYVLENEAVIACRSDGDE